MISSFVAAAFGAVSGHFLTRYSDRWFASAMRTEGERDKISTEIVGCLDEILQLCEVFWTSAATELGQENIRLVAIIPAKLHHVNSLIVDLFIDTPELKRLSKEEFKAIHQISTGGSFSDPDRIASASVLGAAYSDILTLRRGVIRRRSKIPRTFLG